MKTTEDTESTELFENNSLSDAIIGAAITVHRERGPGLLINFNVPLLMIGIRRISL